VNTRTGKCDVGSGKNEDLRPVWIEPYALPMGDWGVVSCFFMVNE
jgi:hypothetical protein